MTCIVKVNRSGACPKVEEPSYIFGTVSRVLVFIRSLFSRYCGSKLGCGYQFHFEKILTREEAKSYLPYVSAAAYAFTGKSEEFLRPFGWIPILPAELDFKDMELLATQYAYFDKKTGLKISFAEKGDELLIAIPGLLCSAGSEKDEKTKDWVNGWRRDPAKIMNIAGGVSHVYPQAERVITALLSLERFKGKQVTLVGQCFGGSIASYVALKKGVKAICLNSFQLGAGLQAKIGDEALKRADSLITHVCVEKDWLTTLKVIDLIDRVLTGLCIRTPGNFGRKYLIPTAYSSSSKSHGFVLGSLMAYLGYDKRATPNSIKSILVYSN